MMLMSNHPFLLNDERMPLHFHEVHGENIFLSKYKTKACRSKDFCKGIVFSDRHISINEPVYVKCLEISTKWDGFLRIGFTTNDPVSMKSKLPDYSYPFLIPDHGNWVKSFDKPVRKDTVLCFYVDEKGDVRCGTGEEEYGILLSGVNVSGKIWAVLDIYGSTVAVEFVDPNSSNQDKQSEEPHSNCSICNEIKNSKNSFAFHAICGKYVTLDKNGSVVRRKSGLLAYAFTVYTFTEQPLEIGKTIAMKVLQTDRYVKEPFTYGITSCDPSNIDASVLSQNSEDLLDRPEYWVVKHKTHSFETEDVIKFTIHSEGELEMLINDDPEPICYVDITQPLWLFVNLSGVISKLKILSDMCSVEELNGVFKNMAARDKLGPSSRQSDGECIICCKEVVDCVVYRCGHMCMCYQCAMTLMKPGSRSQCPICRDPINDIIRVFK